MSLPKMTTAVDNISQLDDLPNAVGGLSAAELKARFDKAGGDIKTFLNETLIPAIEALGPVEEAARNQAIQSAIDALELDTTVENLQKAIAAAEARAKEYADTKDAANLTAAKEYADSKAAAVQAAAAENAAAEADAALAAAKSYADAADSATLAAAERVSGADADNAEAAAKTYADTKDAANLQAAKEYTDGKIPAKLPNPQKLKFIGAVSGEYDGSEEKTINIPAGGGSAELPEVLGNLGAAMEDAAAGSIPVAAGDAAWALRKLIEEYTGDESELSGYIPSTAWVNALLSAATVRYDKGQGLTNVQQRMARANIGAKISRGTYWSEPTHTYDAIAAASYGELYISDTPPSAGITAPVLMIPGENSRGTVTISALDATGAWYTGTIKLSTAETSLTKVSAPLPTSAAADAGKLLQVGTDGKAKWGDKMPTALKSPAALTFTGAATGTYDGSAALTINIPEGGSGGSSGGGGLRKMSAVSSYLGIPVAELPTDGTIWMCISSGDNAELYSGTITIEGGEISANNLIAVSNGSVIQLNQAAIVSAGFAIYGMPATDYVGVWQLMAQGGSSGGTDISLGLTTATVGQIAKISAVDDNGIKYTLPDMAAEEIAEMEEVRLRYEAEEKHRPYTIGEVSEMLIRQQINTLSVDDAAAVRMKDFYPPWESGQAYTAGYKITYNGDLYKVLQAHTSQESWLPGSGTESLYARIDEQHDGTKYDPIPYNGNMALENGKYYTQSGVLYKCTRDTGNPVYNSLAELVGLYVEVAA